MLQITMDEGRVGPFATVFTFPELYRVTGLDGSPGVYPKTVIGVGIVEPWVGALPGLPEPDLEPIKAREIAAIDAEVDEIYRLAIGARQAEYEEAERQAHAYADAGYSGAVPGMVQSWATAKEWTALQAAQQILQQAAIWRGAQEQIRAARLARKEQVRSAGTQAAISAALQAWAQFAVAVRAQLAIGGA